MHGDKAAWDNVKKLYIDENLKNIELSPLETYIVRHDFKRMPISLSRYKLVGKLLSGRDKVLEAGCNDGFKTPLIAQFCKHVHGIDFDADAVSYAKEHFSSDNVTFEAADFLNYSGDVYDAVFSMDVIEHIPPQEEDCFMQNAVKCLHEHGVCIIGTPNITAAAYQSETSRIGHINLYSHERLKALMDKYFYNSFMFGMNDELVHLGFAPMCHYLVAMGVGPK